MRAVETDDHAALVRRLTPCCDVEQLPAAIENAWQPRESTRFIERANHVGLVDRSPVAARHADDVGSRIPAVKSDLTLKGVDVRGKVEGRGNDLAPLAARPIEGRQQR